MGQSKVILNNIPQILLSSDNVVLLSCDNGIRADLKSVVQQCIGSSNLSLSVLIKYEQVDERNFKTLCFKCYDLLPMYSYSLSCTKHVVPLQRITGRFGALLKLVKRESC